jgi:photosystem II Psb27 protein
MLPPPQGAILDSVRATLVLPKDDPAKEDRVRDLRKDINNWVATYRREPKVSGKPSYRCA